MESILTSIKKLIGITEDDDGFDTDIIMHINTAFMGLTDLHVGPSTGFIITDKTAVWTDFIKDPKKLAASKSYVYLRVKLLFDSESLSSAHIESTNRQIDKLEWLLNVNAESTESEDAVMIRDLTSKLEEQNVTIDEYEDILAQIEKLIDESGVLD